MKVKLTNISQAPQGVWVIDPVTGNTVQKWVGPRSISPEFVVNDAQLKRLRKLPQLRVEVTDDEPYDPPSEGGDDGSESGFGGDSDGGSDKTIEDWRTEAEDAGVIVDQRWGIPRLKKEISKRKPG